MEITLEKIELVKDRTGVTYAEAKEALEEADGSVVDAIIAIEETINAGQMGRGFGKKGEALFENLKTLIKKGNVARVQVKRDDEIILNVPVNAGIVGVVIAPIASIVALVAAFGFKCTIEVVKDDGTIIDVSDAVADTVGKVTEKGSVAVDEVKERGSEIYQRGRVRAEEAADKVKKAAEDSDISEAFKNKARQQDDEAEDDEEETEEKASDKEEDADQDE